jgi:hypothetical protein
MKSRKSFFRKFLYPPVGIQKSLTLIFHISPNETLVIARYKYSIERRLQIMVLVHSFLSICRWIKSVNLFSFWTISVLILLSCFIERNQFGRTQKISYSWRKGHEPKFIDRIILNMHRDCKSKSDLVRTMSWSCLSTISICTAFTWSWPCKDTSCTKENCCIASSTWIEQRCTW